MPGQRLFRGWWIVLGCTVSLAFGSVSLAIASFGVFLKPLALEFGWGRAQTAAALTVHVLGIVIAAPLVGRFIDRWGARRVVLVAHPLFVLLFASQALMTSSIWHLYAAYFVSAFAATGTSPIAYTKIVCAWFDRRRGLALGITLAGMGLGMAICPALAQLAVAHLGWREAYIVLALVSACIVLPIAAWGLRDDPAQLNLRPDGDTDDRATERHATAGPEYTAPQARGDRLFWMMVLGFGLVALAYSGIGAHLVPMLSDRGFSARDAALAQVVVGMSLVAGRLGTGYLLDRLWGPRVAAVAVAITAAGIGLLLLAPLGGWSFVGAALFGIAVGAEIDIMAYLVGRYFGMRHFASIFGQLNAAFFLCSAFGPIAVGLSHDLTGTYATIAPLLMTLLVVGGLLFLRFRPYPRPALQ